MDTLFQNVHIDMHPKYSDLYLKQWVSTFLPTIFLCILHSSNIQLMAGESCWVQNSPSIPSWVPHFVYPCVTRRSEFSRIFSWPSICKYFGLFFPFSAMVLKFLCADFCVWGIVPKPYVIYIYIERESDMKGYSRTVFTTLIPTICIHFGYS